MKRTLYICLFLAYVGVQAAPSAGTPVWNIAAENKHLFKTIESKVCNLSAASVDLTGVYTTIDALEQKTLINNSLIDYAASALEDVVSTETVLAAAVATACTIEQFMQSASDSIVNAKDALGMYISAADVGVSGYTISQPGKYILCEVIDTTASIAISIDADNVELDLNGFSILNADIAISVINGASKFVIHNGLIKDTTICGIDIDDNASSGLIQNIWIENPGDDGLRCEINCANITMQDVRVTNASADGFFISQSSDITLIRCFATGNGSSGIDFGTGCSRVLVKDCLIAQNGPTGALGGLEFSDCSSVEVRNCFCAANNSISGINLDNVDNALVKGSICIENGEGIRVQNTSTQIKLIGNVCISNTLQGIELDTASNCFVYENIALLNGVQNIDETAGGPNSILGNWALGAFASDNYGMITSTINQVVIDQSMATAAQPTKWQNISMTT